MTQPKTISKFISWSESLSYHCILFIDATPGSEVAYTFRKVLVKQDLRIKIVERLETPIKFMICKLTDLKEFTGSVSYVE